MEGKCDIPHRNILIHLSSLLLSEALQELLDRDRGNFRTALARQVGTDDDFVPHKILVDAATLEQEFPPQWSGARVILIDTGLPEEELIKLLCTRNLDGVISTSTDTELFRKALRTIATGQVWIEHERIRSLLHELQHIPPQPRPTSFSKREREIIVLIAAGCRNREIAARLNISEETVKCHIGRILRKTNATNRAQLAPLALAFRA